jgi:DNA primase
MARLPDAVIQKIKAEVSLLRLVESQGYKLTKQGKDYALCCPFHDDKEPSCIITPKSNLFNCFGCGAAGSVIDWVMKTQGVSFRFACELLQKDIAVITESGTKTVEQNTKTKLAAPITQNTHFRRGAGSPDDLDSQTALREVIDYYHQCLKESPEALAYLDKRGLNNPELIDHFKLGFANRTLGYHLPEKQYKAGKILRGKLQDIGILRSSGHEHFNGALVIPVIDADNNITGVYGRKITRALRAGTAYHLYLPGPHKGVWNIKGIGQPRVAPGVVPPATLEHPCSSEVILCEALIDAMTFWVNGFRNVTASYGTNGFTADHLAAFKANNIERVLIAYDRDESGNKAAAELAKKLQQEGFGCYRIELPKGMDVNAFACEVTPANKSLGLVIRSAQWMGEGEAQRREQETGNRQQEEKPIQNKAKEQFEKQLKTVSEQMQALDKPPLTEPAASVLPELPADIEAETTERETTIKIGDRRYRIRGLNKNLSYDQLKINLLVYRGEAFDVQGGTNVAGAGSAGAYHVDNLDIYSAKNRAVYIKQAAMELGTSEDVLKSDLGKVLLKLEELQEQQINDTLTPEDKTPEISETDQQAALSLLTDPKLIDRLITDFGAMGIVGEDTNLLVAYLSCLSRKLPKPLAVMIQSSSAAGKSSVMESVLSLMPEEERVQYSAMTGQSLFYMGETNLKHKILAIAEEEGATNASYALKLLQSEGQITIASTGKDDTTGNLVTKEYKVEGPVMLLFTTTAIDVDEELKNRCLILDVNESREQTAAIHAQQRFAETLEGRLAHKRKHSLIALHNNVQRILRPLEVVNPYAQHLTFIDDKLRTRRDQLKYLTLIRSIALLHQHQRTIKTSQQEGVTMEYIEATLDDIALANRLCHQVLGKTLDELPPQTRKLLQRIYTMVTEHCKVDGIKQSDYRFSRRNIREFTQWSDGQLKIHCGRLTDLEYLLVHNGGRGRSIEYELLYDGDVDGDQRHLMGLIDVEQLKSCGYDGEKLGANVEKLAPSQGQVRPKLGGSQAPQKPLNATEHTASEDINNKNVENAVFPVKKEDHRNHTQSAVARV